jgi:hypothetical protein
MIKGCKHYFSMFGMMIFTINRALSSFFNRIYEQIKKHIDVLAKIIHTQLEQNFKKNQTYQG